MKCEICKIELKRIGHHIQSKHGLTLQQYYDTYLKKENEDICPTCGNKKKFGRDLGEAYRNYCSPSCAISSDEIQKKMRDTCKEHHGVEYPAYSDKIREKSRLTMLDRYGVEKPLQSKDIQEKCKLTCLERYGVDHPSKIPLVKQKKIETEILHFGDRYCRTPEARQMYRENFIKNIESQNDGIYQVQQGRNEKTILNELETHFNITIQRDFSAIGYYPDGYIKELNLIVEIYEPHHYHTCYIERDERRKNELIQFLKCEFFIISEKEWLSNKEQVISNFKLLIDSLSNPKEQTI